MQLTPECWINLRWTENVSFCFFRRFFLSRFTHSEIQSKWERELDSYLIVFDLEFFFIISVLFAGFIWLRLLTLGSKISTLICEDRDINQAVTTALTSYTRSCAGWSVRHGNEANECHKVFGLIPSIQEEDSSMHEIIRRVNNTEYRLAAHIMTKSLDYATQFTEAVEARSV